MLHQLMPLLLKLLPLRKPPQQPRKLLPQNPLLQKQKKHQQPRQKPSQKLSQKLSLKPNQLLKKKLLQKRKKPLSKNLKLLHRRKKRLQSLLASRSTRTHVPT